MICCYEELQRAEPCMNHKQELFDPHPDFQAQQEKRKESRGKKNVFSVLLLIIRNDLEMLVHNIILELSFCF